LAPFPDESECDVPLELLANDGDDGAAFTVPLEDDHYECFYFTAPTEPITSLGFSPIIGDSRVLHHGLLYGANDSDSSGGVHEDCTGSHPDATLLAAWAPSGLAYGLPPGVGLQLPSGEDAILILEIHYTNLARHPGAEDRSGVRVCGTREPQPNVAAVHWLGTEDISLPPGATEAGTTCAPDLDEPVNILSVTPHLHQLGARSRMVINRSDGSEQVLFDEPFDFNAQVGYNTPAVLLPGDSITSTCQWNNTSGGSTSFGEGTEDEMCYLFTLAYPAGALDTGSNFFGRRRSGENKCMN
jgi:hypothetical protein